MIHKKIAEEIKSLIAQDNFSGVLSVYQNGEKTCEISGGYRDIPNQLPITLDTIFGLASGTKTLTALGILLLHQEGKLHIDDSLRQYTNDLFPNYTQDITIKHLLTHTSGIPDYLDEEQPSDLSHIAWNKLLKPLDYFQYFPMTQTEFPPGKKFKYNNGAYILLAYIIDCITGNYHNYIENFLHKAGLTTTGFYRFDNLPKNAANGYIHQQDGTFKTNIYDLPIIGGGDGGIFSNAFDIHLLWQKLFDGEIISNELLHEMITPHIETKNGYYGYGLWLSKQENHIVPEMIGQDQGVSFFSSYNPQSKESIVVICNNDTDAWKITKYL